jgi:hypothetical protein
MLRVTVDSTVLDEQTIARLNRSVEGLDVRFAATTVSSRERARDRGQQFLGVTTEDLVAAPVNDPGWEPSVREAAVLGEWRLGLSVLAADDAPAQFEKILRIITSGSFPKQGDRGETSRPASVASFATR